MPSFKVEQYKKNPLTVMEGLNAYGYFNSYVSNDLSIAGKDALSDQFRKLALRIQNLAFPDTSDALVQDCLNDLGKLKEILEKVEPGETKSNYEIIKEAIEEADTHNSGEFGNFVKHLNILNEKCGLQIDSKMLSYEKKEIKNKIHNAFEEEEEDEKDNVKENKQEFIIDNTNLDSAGNGVEDEDEDEYENKRQIVYDPEADDEEYRKKFNKIILERSEDEIDNIEQEEEKEEEKVVQPDIIPVDENAVLRASDYIENLRDNGFPKTNPADLDAREKEVYADRFWRIIAARQLVDSVRGSSERLKKGSFTLKQLNDRVDELKNNTALKDFMAGVMNDPDKLREAISAAKKWPGHGGGLDDMLKSYFLNAKPGEMENHKLHERFLPTIKERIDKLHEQLRETQDEEEIASAGLEIIALRNMAKADLDKPESLNKKIPTVEYTDQDLYANDDNKFILQRFVGNEMELFGVKEMLLTDEAKNLMKTGYGSEFVAHIRQQVKENNELEVPELVKELNKNTIGKRLTEIRDEAERLKSRIDETENEAEKEAFVRQGKLLIEEYLLLISRIWNDTDKTVTDALKEKEVPWDKVDEIYKQDSKTELKNTLKQFEAADVSKCLNTLHEVTETFFVSSFAKQRSEVFKETAPNYIAGLSETFTVKDPENLGDNGKREYRENFLKIIAARQLGAFKNGAATKAYTEEEFEQKVENLVAILKQDNEGYKGISDFLNEVMNDDTKLKKAIDAASNSAKHGEGLDDMLKEYFLNLPPGNLTIGHAYKNYLPTVKERIENIQDQIRDKKARNEILETELKKAALEIIALRNMVKADKGKKSSLDKPITTNDDYKILVNQVKNLLYDDGAMEMLITGDVTDLITTGHGGNMMALLRDKANAPQSGFSPMAKNFLNENTIGTRMKNLKEEAGNLAGQIEQANGAEQKKLLAAKGANMIEEYLLLMTKVWDKRSDNMDSELGYKDVPQLEVDEIYKQGSKSSFKTLIKNFTPNDIKTCLEKLNQNEPAAFRNEFNTVKEAVSRRPHAPENEGHAHAVNHENQAVHVPH